LIRAGLDEWAAMPNHLHMVLFIRGGLRKGEASGDQQAFTKLVNIPDASPLQNQKNCLLPASLL